MEEVIDLERFYSKTDLRHIQQLLLGHVALLLLVKHFKDDLKDLQVLFNVHLTSGVNLLLLVVLILQLLLLLFILNVRITNTIDLLWGRLLDHLVEALGQLDVTFRDDYTVKVFFCRILLGAFILGHERACFSILILFTVWF
uniref:Uncharacterized protein n=1 Tax=Strombidium inclinatum TaxID=197538 RepID=A0A7S3IJK7_9SPIT|eukprot:CAMPEP_0170497356 /NCGR_PEP_ID=MMETSP0208-20121228/24576_1 /TAXON_ID=197538 /ORGANISM="Strombidium inclinatum, Strain S3" /LENGTH=141 /DNA_ID=CAMNT_0010774155 /DNA_START=290 /DNA_END=715 /DNA_ORIENTATION=-